MKSQAKKTIKQNEHEGGSAASTVFLKFIAWLYCSSYAAKLKKKKKANDEKKRSLLFWLMSLGSYTAKVIRFIHLVTLLLTSVKTLNFIVTCLTK